ncbi:plasminogen receptor (KT) isoform 1-T1 [Lycaon pictus]
MLRWFLSHLLGVWLLLSQLPREIPATGDKILKACGRDYVRLQIEVCGSSWWGRKAGQQRERRQISEPLAEVVPSSIINDPEILSLMLQSIPGMPQELRIATQSGKEKLLRELHFVLEDSNLNLEEMKKTFLNTQFEAEDKSLSKLDKHPRKKRDNYIKMSDKCCNVGCTRRELASRC